MVDLHWRHKLCDSSYRRRYLRLKHAWQFTNIRCDSTRRQALQERLALNLCAQPWIKHRQHSTIGCAANQSTQALLQTDHRLRHAVFIEARAALILDVSLASSHDRIAGDGERQLIDNHTRQLLAADVNALPET